MRSKVLLCALTALCALTLCACGQKQGEVEKTAVPVQEGSQKPAQDPGTLIASVNGHKITAGDVDQEMKGLLAPYRDRMPPEQLQELEPQMREQAVENLISKRLLLQEAAREKIQPGEQEVLAEIETVTGQFPSPEAFQEQLTAMGISREQLSQDIEDHLKIKGVVARATAELAPVTDEEISEFYKKNIDTFKVPEQIRASHILIKVEKDASEETRALKQKEIADVRERISNGSDFEQLVTEYSDCPSRQQGGDLGLFERGRMIKEFEDAAFKLAPGEVSPVVETPFGYHVIKVTEHKEPRTRELDEVRQEIAEQLKSSREEAAFESFLQNLRQTAQIEYAKK